MDNELRWVVLILLLAPLVLGGCTVMPIQSKAKCEATEGSVWQVTHYWTVFRCNGKDKYGHDVVITDKTGKNCPPMPVSHCFTREEVERLNCRGAHCWNRPVNLDNYDLFEEMKNDQ